jgi:hypothetical protein
MYQSPVKISEKKPQTPKIIIKKNKKIKFSTNLI